MHLCTHQGDTVLPLRAQGGRVGKLLLVSPTHLFARLWTDVCHSRCTWLIADSMRKASSSAFAVGITQAEFVHLLFSGGRHQGLLHQTCLHCSNTKECVSSVQGKLRQTLEQEQGPCLLAPKGVRAMSMQQTVVVKGAQYAAASTPSIRGWLCYPVAA